MILTKTLNIISKNCNKSYYEELGYDTTRDEFIINVLDLPKRSYKKIKVKCDICGKEKEVSFGRYNINTDDLKEEYCCSRKCAQNKSQRRLVEKYGVENIFQLENTKEKIKKTKKEKYGDENYQNHEKRKITCLEKYGETSPLSNKEVRNKIKNTCLERYGVDCTTKIKNLKESQQEKSLVTKFKKSIIYYKDNYNLELLENKGDNYIFKCKNGHNFEIDKKILKNRLIYKTEICTICNKIGHSFISNGEKQLCDFISDYIDDLEIQNRTLIHPYHIDIFSRKMKLGFEFNGIHWHNENFKDKDYHSYKTDLCFEKGINLIHIWEDDWNNKREVIKSNILELIDYNKVKIDEYEIVKLQEKEIENFLYENSIKEIDIKNGYGLIVDDEILSVLCFDKKDEFIIENKNFYNLDKFVYFENYIKDKVYILDKDYENFTGEIKNRCYNIKKINNFNVYKSGLVKIIIK